MNLNEITKHNQKQDKFIGILVLITSIYILSLLVTTINIGLKYISFKNEYSYKNIKLYTAVPIDEVEAKATLMNVYGRVSKSTLYDEDSTLIVYLTNSKRTELIYFKWRDILSNFENSIKNITSIRRADISSIFENEHLLGYVLPMDAMGTAFLRRLDEGVIAHELAHQMLIRDLDGPMTRMYSKMINTGIHEGYANLIGYGGLDHEYMGSDLIGYSGALWSEEILQDDGQYHKHVYKIVNWKGNYYINEYSIENMMIVKNLLMEKEILGLVKSYSSRIKLERETHAFFLNYLKNSGYYKLEGDANALKGSWGAFRCYNEENPCEFSEDVRLELMRGFFSRKERLPFDF